MKKLYVDIKKHWPKIKPHAESIEGTEIWKWDLEKCDVLFRIYGYDGDYTSFDEEWFKKVSKNKFCPKKPSDYESCDWRDKHRGRPPAYWQYVVFRHCHWLANFNLFLAEKAFPKLSWRIITSDDHSCIWNGNDRLFDMNFFALVPNIEEHPFYKKLPNDAEVLPIGERLRIHITDDDVFMLRAYDEGKISLDKLISWFF